MTDSDAKPKNYYENMEKKFREEPLTYDNFDKVQIKLPFRMSLIGASGSGKTNALINLIEHINAFDKIILFAKDVEEPLYASLIDKLRKAEKSTNTQILTVGTKIEELPKLDSISKKNNTLLIVDDMVTEKHKALAGVVEYWTRGRKKNVSMTYLSQSYFDIPSLIRKNCNYFILTKIATNRDLHMILKEMKLGISDEEIERLYGEATKGGFPNFFLIDLEAKSDHPELRYRRNFKPLLDKKQAGEEEKKEDKGKDKKEKARKEPKGRVSRARPGEVRPNPDKLQYVVPPAPTGALVKQVLAIRKDLHADKIGMEDVEMIIENASPELRDAMMEVDWSQNGPENMEDVPDMMDEGAGLSKKRSRKSARVGVRKRGKMSTETEKAMERMRGQRSRPYWSR